MNTAATERLFQHPGVRPRTRTLVLGIGGAGCNIVANMAASWSEGPAVIAMNTDAQSLAGCEAPRVMQIGESTTKGLGANGDTNLGRMAMEESIEPVKDLLHDVDLLIVVAGLGGGTGSGASHVLLQAAHQMSVMTLCFVTLPFPFESDSRKRQAEESLKLIQRIADAVVCMPNEKLIELVDPNAGLMEAFRKADEHVAATVHALWHLLSFRGVLNLDFADLRHLVERSRGLCSFGYGEASGSSRVASVVKALMDSPYLNNGRSISEAAALLVNITGGPDLTLADVQGIMRQIGTLAPPSASLYFGAMIDPSMRNRIALTAIATDVHTAEKPKAAAPSSGAAPADIKEPAKKVRAASEQEQAVLPFTSEDKGKFANVAPTTFKGEDLDIPTYIRRGYKLSFER